MLADVQQSDSCCLTSFSRLGRQGPGTLLQILAGAMRIHHPHGHDSGGDKQAALSSFFA